MSPIVISLLLLCGLSLRVWDIGRQSLWIDEAYTIDGAIGVLGHGYPLLDSGALYTNTPLTVYTTALMMRTFPFDPFDPWALRLPAALFGTALIIAVWFLAKELFDDRRFALATAFFIAFSYQEIAWSRQIRGYAALALFLVLAIAYMWRYYRDPRPRHALLAAILLSIASLFHWVALAFVPAGLAIIAYRASRRHARSPMRGWQFLMTLMSISAITIACYSGVHMTRYFLFSFLPLATIMAGYLIFRAVDAAASRMTSRSRSAVAFLAIIAVGTSLGLIDFMPRQSYRIDLDSPQPDYKAAFSLVNELISPGDAIISSHPSLNRIYTGDNGFGLPASAFDQRGDRGSLGVDSHTGAPIIRDPSALEAIMSSRHGFIVMDGVNASSIGYRPEYVDQNPRTTLVYSSSWATKNDRIWLYRF